ncbi:MAG: TetR/AcrR family transcriptional regulator [Desulfobacteraceae bacterium]|jgi:TetR/AcrR family transcriptional regulator
MKNGVKKKQIIKAATRIFARKGFHQAKMDEIAEAAKVAKGTLYYNYASKSKLFAATVTAGMEEIMDKISRDLESDLPFIEHFRLLISNTIRIYLKNKAVIRIYVNELSSGIDKEALAEIRKVRRRFIRFITETLQTGQEMGYLKPLHRQICATVLLGMVDALCNNQLGPEESYDLDQIIETVIPILSTGMLNPEKVKPDNL